VRPEKEKKVCKRSKKAEIIPVFGLEAGDRFFIFMQPITER
jgi:hypothetical protein